MDTLKILVAQINLKVGDIEGNTRRVIEVSQQAVQQYQPDIVVFPEMTISGYPPEDLLLRPGFFNQCEKALDQIQLANIATTIVVGYPDRVGTKSFNKAAVISHGKILTTYAKQHLPNYTVFDEMRYFSPGHQNACIFKIKNIPIGLIICEDLWHSKPIQYAVEADAQLVLCINASPFDRNKARARENLLADRAKTAKIPIIYANLVGGQDELVFDGGSMVVNEQGQRCQQAAYYEEDFLFIEMQLLPRPHLKVQSLPPRLSEEENIYKALVLGVQDYIKKNGFSGAILGLSGGIDSALTLAIISDALGADRVEAVLMPSRFTQRMSIEDALEQANMLGVTHHIIDIEPIFKSYLATLSQVFPTDKPDVTQQNIQARIRGNILMAMSNKSGRIVLTTGNKSELSVGYSTLYGDMAGGFCVLKDVPKTMVYRLAHYRNLLTPVIPMRVIERPPTAELAEGQLDQDNLPPYPILDEILYLYIEQDMDPTHIYSDRLEQTTVDQVVDMITRNEYKRRQAPIGIRITDRAFGKDRRYPITSTYGKMVKN